MTLHKLATDNNIGIYIDYVNTYWFDSQLNTANDMMNIEQKSFTIVSMTLVHLQRLASCALANNVEAGTMRKQ